MSIKFTNFVFSENGAVGKGSDGRFYAIAMNGDIYAVEDTRVAAQAELDAAER